MKYFLVAGEASGDLHGANLMKALKTIDSHAEFNYFGGDKMQAQGGKLEKHYSQMAFMGFTEVVMNLSTIARNLKSCKAAITASQPDAVILIDFPGFNLKIARFAKEAGFKVCYYISPKVWAWNQKRVLKIKETVDKMFCILPFEVDFYKKWGMQVDYVGNPLLDEIATFEPNPQFRANHDIGNQKIIALLPGSRKQEIERLLPAMLSVVQDYPNFIFAVAAAPTFSAAYYEEIIGDRNAKIVFNETYDLLNAAHSAIVASGTATLETALFNVPQVVVYKGGTISIFIARMLVNIKFISLVNLIMNKRVVTELIQEDCNTKAIEKELGAINAGEGRMLMLKDYADLQKIMGKPGASEATAKLIFRYINT